MLHLIEDGEWMPRCAAREWIESTQGEEVRPLDNPQYNGIRRHVTLSGARAQIGDCPSPSINELVNQ
jgi:hypothetical protein